MTGGEFFGGPPRAMTTDSVQQAWRDRSLAGQWRHQLVVRIRRAHMTRLYQPLQMLAEEEQPAIGAIWNGQNTHPWQAQLVADGPWVTLDEIQSAKYVKDTQTDNGSSTCTVVMDDVAFIDAAGQVGDYHQIMRGYYSPQRGIKLWKRPDAFAENEWADRLNGGFQLELWEGYGPDGDARCKPLDAPNEQGTCKPANALIARTWTGLLDALDIDSHPDSMTITARDFGVLLTDQRLIYRNKAPEIRSPVIFADRGRVLGEVKTGYDADASSTKSGYSPANVLDDDNDSGWVSDVQVAPQQTQYIEIKLQPGFYSQFSMATEFPGMDMFVSLKAAGGNCTWNGAPVADGDWVVGQPGQTVPGLDGDIPFVNHYTSIQGPGKFNLAGLLSAGEGTVLRVSFANLVDHYYDQQGNPVQANGYVAGVFRLRGLAFGTDPKAPVGTDSKIKANGWVLVDDVCDIVRRMFAWAGFKEMNVKNYGWSVVQPLTFGQDQFFIDVITSVMNQGNYLFYMTAPTDDDMSIGVPTFIPQQAFDIQPATFTSIRDTDLLESLSIKWDMSDLPYGIRVRGAQNKKGSTFGQDLVKRHAATYYPPWSGVDYVKISPRVEGKSYDHTERVAGVNRSYVQTQGQTISLSLNSQAECMFAAVLTAVQYALAEVTGQFQMSGMYGFELNAAINIVDEGSGTNSRVWLSSIESDHNMGENGSWHMTCNGALLDTEDLNLIAEDWAYALFRYSLHK